MYGEIEGAVCTKVLKSGCMGEWSLIFEYNNGAKRTLAFVNKDHMLRGLDVIRHLMEQHNTVIEFIEEECW